MSEVDHNYFMTRALELAERAAELGEVPVGAVVVLDGEIIGEGYNQPIMSNDPTAHAEVVALRNAANNLNNYRLPGSILYVTLEPCTMCAGAMVHARINTLVYGASEPKAGVARSRDRLFEAQHLNHRIDVISDVLAAQSSKMLTDFFKQRRG